MTSTDASRPQPPAAPDAGAAMPPAPASPAETPSLAAAATATLERPRLVAASEQQSREPTALLMKLLKMADGYAATGAKRAATDLYFTIVERHGETPQADRARQHLMDIAQCYESAGAVHQARAIYERLL